MKKLQTERRKLFSSMLSNFKIRLVMEMKKLITGLALVMHLVSAEKKMALEPENVPKDTAYAVFLIMNVETNTVRTSLIG